MWNHDDFLGYAAHQSEMEKIIAAGVEAFLNGEEFLTLEVIDDYSDSEIEYIKARIRNEVG